MQQLCFLQKLTDRLLTYFSLIHAHGVEQGCVGVVCLFVSLYATYLTLKVGSFSGLPSVKVEVVVL